MVSYFHWQQRVWITSKSLGWVVSIPDTCNQRLLKDNSTRDAHPTYLQKPEGHCTQEVQVLSWAVHKHAISQAIHHERANLRAARQYDLVPR
jgi:hypothetical protein